MYFLRSSSQVASIARRNGTGQQAFACTILFPTDLSLIASIPHPQMVLCVCPQILDQNLQRNGRPVSQLCSLTIHHQAFVFSTDM